MDLDIGNMQDISDGADKINSFCLSNGISRKRAFQTSLCFMELAENVLRHGFDPSKNNHLEARIIIDKDELTLRMRDDCRPFDFKKMMDEWKEDKDHPEKKIGIRIVRGMAKDVSYTGVFKTNNLIITF
jgi:anti-sigma regulatory factor (Ser/Thr protein kinase)